MLSLESIAASLPVATGGPRATGGAVATAGPTAPSRGCEILGVEQLPRVRQRTDRKVIGSAEGSPDRTASGAPGDREPDHAQADDAGDHRGDRREPLLASQSVGS